MAVFTAPLPTVPTPTLPLPLTVASPAALVPSSQSIAPSCTFPAKTRISATAQPAAFAANWDENNSTTLLKLSSRARFNEASGNKIRGYIADLELYLQMCARPVHHWGYFLLASLGTDEAEKVRRSHVAEAVADYPVFKKNVETLFGKFEFEDSYRAMLRSHAKAGAESIAAYAARTTEVCSKAYAGFSTETQLSLAVDHFIGGLGDATSRDYLLHDRACRAFTWI